MEVRRVDIPFAVSCLGTEVFNSTRAKALTHGSCCLALQISTDRPRRLRQAHVSDSACNLLVEHQKNYLIHSSFVFCTISPISFCKILTVKRTPRKLHVLWNRAQPKAWASNSMSLFILLA
jgi:hypothetical protein